MLIALLSDIHANLEALTRVLAVAEERGATHFYCLGDIVGYGADAQACLDLVRDRCSLFVKGNHDVAVVKGEGPDVDYLPPDGQQAARLHHAQLSAEDRAWLDALPLLAADEHCTLAHASPEHPGFWLRLSTFWQVRAQFDFFKTPVCFIGHSHVPAVVAEQVGVLKVRPGTRFVINNGSVGQPRDGDPRACLGLYDPEAMQYELVRVPYDVEGAARKIVDAGLPRTLATRLAQGR